MYNNKHATYQRNAATNDMHTHAVAVLVCCKQTPARPLLTKLAGAATHATRQAHNSYRQGVCTALAVAVPNERQMRQTDALTQTNSS